MIYNARKVVSGRDSESEGAGVSVRSLIATLVLPLAVNTALAVSVDVSVGCPDAFVGVVERIEEPSAPFHSLAKQRIFFVVEEVISGDVASTLSIKSLKYGPKKFQVGETYRMELNRGRICNALKL